MSSSGRIPSDISFERDSDGVHIELTQEKPWTIILQYNDPVNGMTEETVDGETSVKFTLAD